MKTKLFETYPKVERFTEPKSLKRIKVVIQDTKKVIQVFTGMEPLVIPYLWNNMKKNQFALVFDNETQKLYGYVSKDEYGIPRRYKEMENLTFEDMYQTVGAE